MKLPGWESNNISAKLQSRIAGRVIISVLLVVAAIAGMMLPLYRAGSQNFSWIASASSQTDAELADQTSSPTPDTTAPAVQIPTKLVVNTNGTVSVWFQGQTGDIYRIDYADAKAAALSDMVWKVAADGILATTNLWTEWVDAGETNRPSPPEVNERYYRVVSSTAVSNVTTLIAGGTESIQVAEPTMATTPTIGTSGTTSSATLPAEVLQLLQRKAALTQWAESTAARNLAELQECATLGQLVADGAGSEDALKDALAKTKLRISILVTFGSDLHRSGDRHHAQLFFEAIVQYHSKRATVKQMARCHLWLGKIHQNEGLEWRYKQHDAELANPEFRAAASHYLAAKDVSQDWVRGSGWLGASACYRELGDHDRQRDCLQQLIGEQLNTNGWVSTTKDLYVGPRMRDLANVLVADSYFEQGRWQEAAEVYQQMKERVTARISGGAKEYPGQEHLLDSLNTTVDWSSAQQAAEAATSQTNEQALQ